MESTKMSGKESIAGTDPYRIVVVGGTSGLGLSFARALARTNARLVIFGLTPEGAREAQAQLGPHAFVFAADATDPASPDRAVRECVDRFGGLDGLCHVAGGSGRKFGDGPLDQITDDGWENTIQLNLSSVAWSNRAAIRQFLRQNSGGTILNLSSVLAFSPSPAHFTAHAYAAAKSAIIGLSRSLAATYAAQNIRVNVLAPGLVETPMSRRAIDNPEIMAYIRSKQPLDGGRVAQPADLDAAAVFFMSDASRFVTGQVLSIDGGWSISEGKS